MRQALPASRPVRRTSLVLFLIGFLFAWPGSSAAQLDKGTLYGRVEGPDGRPLPAATVTLRGPGAPIVSTTDGDGQFRFPGLAPGVYEVRAEQGGFRAVNQTGIAIRVGQARDITITLQSAATTQEITVTSDAPPIDVRQTVSGSNVTQTDLEKSPTTRDPWAILQATPGVLTDRINVGGNESGRPSSYTGPGSARDQVVWSVDGVNITDMTSIGSSPTFYDFTAFEEAQITTGGSDPRIQTPGLQVNIVTKRGTNEWRGSGRYFLTEGDGTTITDENKRQLGTHLLDGVRDYGAELGGPIIKDRLWIWGSYGRETIDSEVFAAGTLTPSDFTQKTSAVKINAQLTPHNSATGFYYQATYDRAGEGASPSRSPEATWNQHGSPSVIKVEDSHIFSSNFYLTGLYSQVNGGFSLTPKGEAAVPLLTTSGVYQYGYYSRDTDRTTREYRADGSNFFNTGSLSHEVKFGAGYRGLDVATTDGWPSHTLTVDDTEPIAIFPPENEYRVSMSYGSAYVQDTLTIGNLTANLGLRYDKQSGSNESSVIGANPLRPTAVPGATFKGAESEFDWTSIMPRLGLTYALGESRRTLLRVGYSQFADQLGTGLITLTNPIDQDGPFSGSTIFRFIDVNKDHTFTTGEPFGSSVIVGVPTDSAQFFQVDHRVDADLQPSLTDELLFGVEHALLPEFVVGVNLTYRKVTDLLDAVDLVNDGVGVREARASDYVPSFNVTLPQAAGGSVVPTYRLKPGVSFSDGVSVFNGDREQEYKGASITFNKRLSNRWMLRGNFSWQDWTWKVPESSFQDPNDYVASGFVDGAPVVGFSSSTNKSGVYVNSHWMYNLSGLYQVGADRPWGFNVMFNAFGRQGYPSPDYMAVDPGDGHTRQVQIGDVDDVRLDDLHVVDAGLQKEFSFSDFGIRIEGSVSNLTDANTVLQRQGNVFASDFNQPLETLSPRVFRLGVRLSFK